MPDTNTQTAYNWATELADTTNLRLSMDIPQAAQFANQINELLNEYINKDIKPSGSGLFENFSVIAKEVIFRRLDDLCRNLFDDQIEENQRISVVLRLWLGCLLAAKRLLSKHEME